MSTILPLCSGNAQSREERSFLNLTSFCWALPSTGHQSPFPVLGWWDARILWDQQCTWSQAFHPNFPSSWLALVLEVWELACILYPGSDLSFFLPSFFLNENIIIFHCVLSRFSHVHLYLILWTVTHQAPLPMGFSRQGYWSGLPFPPPENFPDPGIRSESHVSCIGSQVLYH